MTDDSNENTDTRKLVKVTFTPSINNTVKVLAEYNNTSEQVVYLDNISAQNLVKLALQYGSIGQSVN